MSRRGGVLAASAAVVALVLLCAWWLLQAGEAVGGRLPDTGDNGGPGAVALPVPVEAPAPADAAPEALAPLDVAAVVEPAPDAALAGEHALTFTGRVLDPQRRPLPGARVELLGTDQTGAGWERRPRPVDAPRLRCDAEAVTDRDGRFRLAAPEGRAFRPAGAESSRSFPMLRTTAAGCVADTRGVHAQPAGDANVGDIVLEQGAALHGRVIERGGRPVADARVGVDRDLNTNEMAVHALDEAESALTAADGSFALRGVRAGELTLVVEAEGRPLLEHDVEVQPGDARDVGLLMFDGEHRLHGTVRDARGVGIAGLQLRFTRKGDGPLSPLAYAHTDEHGAYEAAGLPAGFVNVLAESVGTHWAAEATAELPRPGPLDLQLDDLPRLHVRALDADGRPVTRGEVSLRRNSSTLARAEFGEDGAEIALSKAGTLLVQGEGCAPYVLAVEVKQLPHDAAGKLQLERESVVRARAVDAAGQPLAQLSVRAEPWKGQLANLGLVVRGLTDASGMLELRGLGPGEWTIRADRLGYRTGRFGATLEAGEVRDMELRFVAGCRLEGLVRTASGAPASQLVVKVGAGSLSTVTDADGRFAFEGLAAGPTWVALDKLPVRQDIEIRDGATTQVELIVPAPAALTGRVRSGGRDVEGVAVQIAAAGGTTFKADTDVRGAFRFDDLMPGLWRLEVRRTDRLVRAKAEVTLLEGQQQHLDLVLSEAHVVALVRRAEDGQPLNNAVVRLRPTDAADSALDNGVVSLRPADGGGSVPSFWDFGGSGKSGKIVTAPDGLARFEDVPPGFYAVTAEADGRLGAKHTLVVPENAGVLSVTLDAPLSARLEGMVLAADDGTLPVVRIFVQPAGAAEPTAAAIKDGRYFIDHLPPGLARVAVQQNRAKGFGQRDDVDLAALNVELIAGETAQADFTVQPIR
jgi:Carboxypeptidase regulatory-like domain